MARIPILIDTSSLPRRLNRLGAGIERLYELSKEEIIRVYILEIVQREWITQQQDELEIVLNEFANSARKTLSHPLTDKISYIHRCAEQLQGIVENKFSDDELLNVVSAAVDQVFIHIEAEIAPISDKHGKKVVDSYFSGGKPFKKRKNRDDFPDAFIYETVVDIAEKSEVPLHCVVADSGLREALTQLDNVKAFKNIEELLRTPIVVEAQSQLKLAMAWQGWLDKFSERLAEYTPAVQDSLDHQLLDILYGRYVRHPGIPDDNNEAMFTGIGGTYDLEVDWTAAESLGGGWLNVPISFSIENECEFYVYRSDSYDVPDGVWVAYADPEEHHYFEAGGTINANISATISIHISDESILSGEFTVPDEIDVEDVLNIEAIEDEYGQIFG